MLVSYSRVAQVTCSSLSNQCINKRVQIMSTPIKIMSCLKLLNNEARELSANGYEIKVTVLSTGLRVVVEDSEHICRLGYAGKDGVRLCTYPFTDQGMGQLKSSMEQATEELCTLKNNPDEASEDSTDSLSSFAAAMATAVVTAANNSEGKGTEESDPFLNPVELLKELDSRSRLKSPQPDEENKKWVPTKYQPYAHPSLGRKHFGLKVFMDDIDDRHFIRHNMYFPANPEGIHEAVKTSVNMFSAGVDSINQQTK